MKFKTILDTYKLYKEVYVYKFLGVYLMYFRRYKCSNRRHDFWDTRYIEAPCTRIYRKETVTEIIQQENMSTEREIALQAQCH